MHKPQVNYLKMPFSHLVFMQNIAYFYKAQIQKQA